MRKDYSKQAFTVNSSPYAVEVCRHLGFVPTDMEQLTGGCGHPDHAGDLLPLWGNHGSAFEIFLTDRFRAEEIIGKTVIIHRKPDDFTTQPSGNAGAKIACGEIKAFAPQGLTAKAPRLTFKK